jgi:hypothetical protein
MMRYIKEFSLSQKIILILGIITFLLLFLSCEEKIEKPEDSMAFAQKLTCEGCHTDADILEELAPGFDEQPDPSGGG